MVSLTTFPMVFFMTLVMVACGTGGGMGDGKKDNNLQGDTPGTGSFASTYFEDASQPYNPNPKSTSNAGGALAGQVVQVDSTEARGNSRWTENGDAGATVQPSKTGSGSIVSATGGSRLDKTAGLRTRYSLIGSKENNRSRVGQSLRADNPARENEEVFAP